MRPRVARAGLIAAVVSAVLLTSGETDAVQLPVDAVSGSQTPRPNILWITSEDNGPELGAYGDAYATTPNLDRLATRGFRYRTAWSNGPVCSAARSTIITGVYPSSNGGEHHRSVVRLPSFMRMYPSLLREAGYYTTNNSKTDYNFDETAAGWHESSPSAHWRSRRPGQPFFAIFNITQSHESAIRQRPHEWAHDVARAPLPPYMPDVRETREDWAQYYDQLTVMDRIAGERLAELDSAGLTDDTIVMYFGDHGSGMPRSKRCVCNSGLQVPLIVYLPPKFRHLGPPEAARPGSESTRLVSFVDLAPTVLSLAGLQPPAWMEGRAFLGRFTAPAPEFLYGFRGRMDERYDLSRSVRDQRYVYIRNYMPHRPLGQHYEYMFGTPSVPIWRQMYEEGRLAPREASFWEPRPSEELYDLETDRWEINNLAGSAADRHVLERLRQALDAHERSTRDVGFMPEYELHRDELTTTAYERGRDPGRYDFDRVYAAAQAASDRTVPLAALRTRLSDADALVRYWGATGVLIQGREAVVSASAELERLLSDSEPGPQLVAAEALARFGGASARQRAIDVLLEKSDAGRHEEYVATLALYSLNQVTDLPPAVTEAVAKLPAAPARSADGLPQRQSVLERLIEAVARNVR